MSNADRTEIDWQEMCEKYPLADVLNPEPNTSLLPTQPLDTFEKVVIGFVAVALLIAILITL